MKKEVEKVGIVRCRSYSQKQVDKAVFKILNLIDFEIKNKSKVLIKPNVVGCFPKNQIAATTNPAIIEAVCKILKKKNCRIFIGDSPFANSEKSFEASGIDKVAKKYGKLVIFEQGKLVKIKDDKAKVWKQLTLPKLVRDVDLVINIPKLKTHTLTRYTGAIKNLYGLIPGGLKQRLHNQARGDKKFSNLLVDIYQNVKPELNIMDGVVGMEGEGATSGESKKVGLILASKNAVALDIACSKLIGYKSKKINAVKLAIKRKLYSGYKVNLIGAEFNVIDFKKPSSQQVSRTKKLIRRLFKEKPIICDKKRCIRCGMCARHCPVKAIDMDFYPVIDKKKCIRCFCCMEICPENALGLKK